MFHVPNGYAAQANKTFGLPQGGTGARSLYKPSGVKTG
jgi:hypothetical protein